MRRRIKTPRSTERRLAGKPLISKQTPKLRSPSYGLPYLPPPHRCRGDVVAVETYFTEEGRLAFRREWKLMDVATGKLLGAGTRWGGGGARQGWAGWGRTGHGGKGRRGYGVRAWGGREGGRETRARGRGCDQSAALEDGQGRAGLPVERRLGLPARARCGGRYDQYHRVHSSANRPALAWGL